MKPSELEGLLIDKLELFSSFMHVYLFGSAICPVKFRADSDIDLLLLYSNFTSDLIPLCERIFETLNRETNHTIHLTVFSIDEEQTTGFLSKIGPDYIKLK